MGADCDAELDAFGLNALLRIRERIRVTHRSIRRGTGGIGQHERGCLEARARSDLGMVKAGETFYLVNAEQR